METNSPPTPAPYMLFFRNSGPEVYHHLSADGRQQLITRWNEWFEGLVAQGKAIEGQPLEPETRIVAGVGGARITDGPFPEAKEAIARYVTLFVTGFQQATQIPPRHPAL